MDKLKLIDALKNKSNVLYNKYIKQNNQNKADIYVSINKLLNIEDSFKNMPIETALNILSDLQFDTKDSIKIYKVLAK